MTYRTHIIGGMTSALLIRDQMSFLAEGGFTSPSFLLLMAGGILGSLLPDIDHKNSYIGRKTLGIFSFLKHRGLTHSLIFALSILTVMLIFNINNSFTLGLFVGILSHLALDLITHSGLEYLFYPFKFPIRLPKINPIKTGGIFEVFIFIGLVALFISMVKP